MMNKCKLKLETVYDYHNLAALPQDVHLKWKLSISKYSCCDDDKSVKCSFQFIEQ